MRVVYDTNILARIVTRRGEVLKLKHDISSGSTVLITSEHILEELERVLYLKFGLIRRKAKISVNLLRHVSEVVTAYTIEPTVRDRDDDHILATALSGKAERIITLDKDLLVLKEYKTIPITLPPQM